MSTMQSAVPRRRSKDARALHGFTVHWQLWQAAFSMQRTSLCHKSDSADKPAQLTIRHRGRRHLICQRFLLPNKWFGIQKGKGERKLFLWFVQLSSVVVPWFIHLVIHSHSHHSHTHTFVYLRETLRWFPFVFHSIVQSNPDSYHNPSPHHNTPNPDATWIHTLPLNLSLHSKIEW